MAVGSPTWYHRVAIGQPYCSNIFRYKTYRLATTYASQTTDTKAYPKLDFKGRPKTTQRIYDTDRWQQLGAECRLLYCRQRDSTSTRVVALTNGPWSVSAPEMLALITVVNSSGLLTSIAKQLRLNPCAADTPIPTAYLCDC